MRRLLAIGRALNWLESTFGDYEPQRLSHRTRTEQAVKELRSEVSAFIRAVRQEPAEMPRRMDRS